MNSQPTPPRRVGAGHGLKWLGEALAMVRRWPTVFLSMGLIVAIISLVPWVGSFAILIMGPALLAGITMAADSARRGQTPAIHQLFAMFEVPKRRNEALKLCLPLVAGSVIAHIVIKVALLSATSKAGIRPEALRDHPEQVLALLESASVAPWLMVAVVIVLLAWTLVALAIPRVALGHDTAFAAMGRSFRLIWHNITAWIVAFALFFAGLVVVGMLLMLTHVLALMQVGMYITLYAVLGPLLLAAWRDLDGQDTPPDHDRTPPPPEPPRPTGVLEA